MSIMAASLCGRPGAEQLVDRHLGEVRVGNVAVAQFPGEFHGLDFEVKAFGDSGVMPRQAEVRQDVERDQRGQALALRRDFQNLMAGEGR